MEFGNTYNVNIMASQNPILMDIVVCKLLKTLKLIKTL